jgi:hypothetical protein
VRFARVGRAVPANALVKADASFRDAVLAAAEGGRSYRQIAEASMGFVSHEGARKIAKVRGDSTPAMSAGSY